MHDADRLTAITARINASLLVLDHYARVDAEPLLQDEVRLGHLKYGFQTAIEACIDAAQHVVADRGLGMPASNSDAFHVLARAKLISTELADGMGQAVGFRNVLVHQYAEVDDHRVVGHLADLPRLREFVSAMSALVAAADDPP
jgi:uncharacterized protein YutE (UPF0331/DUF86 family)